MTLLRHKLRERVQVRTPVQSPNDDGGFDRSYTTMATIWAGFKAVKKGFYVRGVQVEEAATHEFLMRRTAIDTLGGGYSQGFSSGFSTGYHDLSHIKSNCFLFVQRGSTTKGRLFRIHEFEDAKERREYYKIRAEEIEEVSPNYP